VNKKYVRVDVSVLTDGTQYPQRIYWPDGRSWNVDRVLHMACPVQNEFEGIRYTILIGSAEKYIYRVRSKWYVEPAFVEVDTS